MPLGSRYCGQCGKEFVEPQPNANSDIPAQSQPQPKGASLGGRVTILLAALTIAFLWIKVSNNNSPNMTSSASRRTSIAEPTTEWPADLLLFSYKQNEVKADQDFKGQRLLVSGKVGRIGKDILDNPYVTLDEEEYGLRGVQAFFVDSDLPKLAALHSGQTIKVIGTCNGLMMNVLLKDSVLKSVGP